MYFRNSTSQHLNRSIRLSCVTSRFETKELARGLVNVSGLG